MKQGYTTYVKQKVTEPRNDKENVLWMVGQTKYLGCLCSLVSLDIIFQLDGCTNLHDAWEKLKNLYGTTNEARGYQIDNELMSLYCKYFENI
jgi:hypothetical protein